MHQEEVPEVVAVEVDSEVVEEEVVEVASIEALHSMLSLLLLMIRLSRD